MRGRISAEELVKSRKSSDEKGMLIELGEEKVRGKMTWEV